MSLLFASGHCCPRGSSGSVVGGEESSPGKCCFPGLGLCLKKGTGKVELSPVSPSPPLHSPRLRSNSCSYQGWAVGGRRPSVILAVQQELISYQLWRMKYFRLKAPSLRLKVPDQCRSHLALRRKGDQRSCLWPLIRRSSHFNDILNQIVILRRNYVFWKPPKKASNIIINEVIFLK